MNLKTVSLAVASALTLTTSIIGFVSYGRADPDQSGLRRTILVASLFALLASTMLGLNAYMPQRRSLYMISAVLLFAAGIMFAVAATRLKKLSADSPHSLLTAASVICITIFAVSAVGAGVAIFGARGGHVAAAPPAVETEVNLQPSYVTEDGAVIQLQEMQTGAKAAARAPTAAGVRF